MCCWVLEYDVQGDKRRTKVNQQRISFSRHIHEMEDSGAVVVVADVSFCASLVYPGVVVVVVRVLSDGKRRLPSVACCLACEKGNFGSLRRADSKWMGCQGWREWY
jgi:hypothetical protein